MFVRFNPYRYGRIDDDLDLFVITPDGVRIDWAAVIDDTQPWIYNDDTNPDSVVVHAEAVTLFEEAPYGVYQFGVAEYSRLGPSRDNWRVQVNIDGNTVALHEGFGTTLPPFTFEQQAPVTHHPASRASPITDEGPLIDFRDPPN